MESGQRRRLLLIQHFGRRRRGWGKKKAFEPEFVLLISRLEILRVRLFVSDWSRGGLLG
jgi:hypothetical protein